MEIADDKKARIQTEISVLERFGLRWSVLAAWCTELERFQVRIPADILKKLDKTRVEIASGCIASCGIGGVLGEVEGQLISLATSSGPGAAADAVNMWMELLGHAMSDPAATERLLSNPAVRFRYAECGFGSCSCGRE